MQNEIPNNERLTKLAPSGVSPWDHRGQVTDDGCLTLTWKHGDSERIRCFTQEETATLLDLLYNARDQILSHHLDI